MIDRGRRNLLGIAISAVDYEYAVDKIIEDAKAGRVSIVDQHVDTALLFDNGLDGCIHRGLIGYIHLYGSQIDAVHF